MVPLILRDRENLTMTLGVGAPGGKGHREEMGVKRIRRDRKKKSEDYMCAMKIEIPLNDCKCVLHWRVGDQRYSVLQENRSEKVQLGDENLEDRETARETGD